MNLPTDLRIAIRNLGRSPKRTALGLGSILIAQAGVMFMNGFINGERDAVFAGLTGPMVGHLQVHAPGYRKDHAMEKVVQHSGRLLTSIRGTAGVSRATARLYAPVLVALGEMGHVGMVMGLDLDAESGAQGLLASCSTDQRPGPREVLVGSGMAEEMNLKPGQTLALVGQSADGAPASGLFRIKAVVQTAVDAVNRRGVLMGLSAAQTFLGMGDAAHEIVIHAQDPDRLADLLAGLNRLPGLRGLELMTWDRLQPSMAGMIQMMDSMNGYILVLVLLTAAAGIANTMLMATFERQREFGVLLALGCRPQRLVRILLYESLCLGLGGVVLGLLIGGGLVAATAWHGIVLSKGVDVMGLSATVLVPRIAGRAVVTSLVGVGLTSALAAMWPARRIARLDPMTAIRS